MRGFRPAFLFLVRWRWSLPAPRCSPADTETVYTIGTTAHLAQMSRRAIVVYCKHDLISPAADPTKHGYCFIGKDVRTLLHIQDLRTIGDISFAGIKIILDFSNELEELRSAVMHNGSPIP